jgi:putative ATP-dependent endonuclease of OLD family
VRLILKKLLIENVLSFGKETTVNFNSGINILVGANGSGKSNLMQTVYTFLYCYLFWGFQEDVQELQGTVHFNRRAYRQELFRLTHHRTVQTTKHQRIFAHLSFGESDLNNIEIIQKHLNQICKIEKDLNRSDNSDIHNVFQSFISGWTRSRYGSEFMMDLELGTPSLTISSIDQVVHNLKPEQQAYIRYANYFEKLKYLIDAHNTKHPDAVIPSLSYPLKFYSPYRLFEEQSQEIRLPGTNLKNLYSETKDSFLQGYSKDIKYAFFFFTDKFNQLDRNRELFEKDPDVRKAKEILRKIGNYDFDIETRNKRENSYGVFISHNNTRVPFETLSSGEKEVLGFLFSVIAFDLRNALIVIDEPENHLHPQWQGKLIEQFQELASERSLQIILSTHSPGFLTPASLSNVIRLKKPNNETEAITPFADVNFKDSQKDLIEVFTLTNSAKAFFSSTVVLVEGVIDEIVFSFILKRASLLKGIDPPAIITVGGKSAFKKYASFLLKVGCQVAVIGDLDNLIDSPILDGNSKVSSVRKAVGDIKSKDISKFANSSDALKALSKRDLMNSITEILKGTIDGTALDQNKVKSCFDKLILAASHKDLRDLLNQALPVLRADGITKLEDAILPLRNEIKVDGIEVPVYLLKEGNTESYLGTQHNIQGGLDAVTYLRSVQDVTPIPDPVRELFDIGELLISHM